MKLQILILSLLGLSNLKAQSQTAFFEQLRSDALILSEDELIRGKSQIEAFVKDLVGSKEEMYSYDKEFSIEVHAGLHYEIGMLNSDSKSYAVMFLNRPNASEQEIEFLVIYEQKETSMQPADLDQSRTEWMRLCNAHEADELVTQLYTENTYYYNRGRLLQGTEAVAAEYSYMNNPNYSLQLTPKHIVMVTSDIAYEVGRCSGSYPNPYMLLWKKGTDGKWQILMDSND